MAIDYSVIGSRIKQARLAKNMTQEDLADKIDISVAFLSRVERGKAKINLNRLNQLCDLLEISEGTVLTGVGSNSNNYLNNDLSNLLEGCPPDKLKLIYDIAKVIINEK